MRPFQKKNRLGKFFVNSLILGITLFFLSGPIKEICIFVIKSFSNLNQTISENSGNQIDKLINLSELVQIQRKKLNKLNQTINKQEQELNSLRAILAQTNNLEDILSLKKTTFPKSIACHIISRSPSSWQKEIIIDKGSDNGLKAGMVVVTNRGILGQIQEVQKNYSIVQLMASSQVRFGAMVERTKVMGILFGDKTGYAQFKFIPIGSDIKKGDLVITSEVNPLGIERLFPTSYPVGQVVEIAHYDNNSELFVKVKLFEDGLNSYSALVLLPGGIVSQNKINFNLFAQENNIQKNIIPEIKTPVPTQVPVPAPISVPILNPPKETIKKPPEKPKPKLIIPVEKPPEVIIKPPTIKPPEIKPVPNIPEPAPSNSEEEF